MFHIERYLISFLFCLRLAPEQTRTRWQYVTVFSYILVHYSERLEVIQNKLIADEPGTLNSDVS